MPDSGERARERRREDRDSGGGKRKRGSAREGESEREKDEWVVEARVYISPEPVYTLLSSAPGERERAAGFSGGARETEASERGRQLSPLQKKSTFINLPADICAHNFRDPAIKEPRSLSLAPVAPATRSIPVHRRVSLSIHLPALPASERASAGGGGAPCAASAPPQILRREREKEGERLSR